MKNIKKRIAAMISLCMVFSMVFATVAVSAEEVVESPTTPLTEKTYNYITAADFHKDADKYVVIDTRKLSDYFTDRIEYSISADVSSCIIAGDGNINAEASALAVSNLKAVVKGFGDKAGVKPTDDKVKYVLVCYSGDKYAKAAADILASPELMDEKGPAGLKLKVDPKNIFILEGGMNAYRTAYAGDVTTSSVDVAADGTISYYARSNKNMATTMHYSVGYDQTGAVGGQQVNAMFKAIAKTNDYYDALIAQGGIPWSEAGALAEGEYINRDNGTNGNYSALDIKISYKDKKYSMAETITTTADGKAANIHPIFSGNINNQSAWKTGCFTCNCSCTAGITVSNGLPYYTLVKQNAETMPKEDDTYVKVTVNVLDGDYISSEQLNADKDAYVITDVRKAADYKSAHIDGSVSADVDSAVQAGEVTEEAKANLKAVVDKNGKKAQYVLVCYSGNKYANMAKKILVEELGVPEVNVHILLGGFNQYSKDYPSDIVPRTSPNTADEADMMLWMLLALVSVGGVSYGLKRRHN